MSDVRSHAATKRAARKALRTITTPEIKIDDFLAMTEEEAYEWIERTTGVTLRGKSRATPITEGEK